MEETTRQTEQNSVRKIESNERQQLGGLSSASCHKVLMLRSHFDSAVDFISKYNPDRQAHYLQNQYEAYTGKAPSFYILDCAFGKGTAKAWVMAQLQNLSEFCGVKDKMEVHQMMETADIITSAYPKNLRVSELSLFFAKVKQGVYGKFYGSIDPIQITTSLYEFFQNRGNEIARLENKNN